jgi:multiple sugar transport system permease protein
VGFSNYIDVLGNAAFRLALKNMLIFMGISIPLIMTLSFLLALALYELKPPKLVYLFMVLPIAIPSAAAAGLIMGGLGHDK